MPITSVDGWSTTANLNSDVNGNSIAENCSPAGINNAMREIMAQVAATPLAETAATMRTNLGVSATADTPTLVSLEGLSLVAGDILYATAADTLARLPKGTAKQALFQNPALTAPEWAKAREVLTATTTFYVATTGSDSNTGLTVGSPWRTINKAITYIAGNLDLGGQTVEIQIADGTYTTGLSATAAWAGPGIVRLKGNTSTPANVIISVTSGNAIYVSGGAKIYLTGMELRTTTSGFCIVSTGQGARVVCEASMRFGACASSHILVDETATVTMSANYSIVGGAQSHWNVNSGATLTATTITTTLTGTPAFSICFAALTLHARAIIFNNTFSGAATGTRFSNTNLSIIHTNGGGANYIPGNAAGTTDASSKYI